MAKGNWRIISSWPMTMKKRTKGCLIAAGIATGALVLGIAALILGFLKYSEYARRVWKEKALPEIASRAGDDAWLSAQIELLGDPDAGRPAAAEKG